VGAIWAVETVAPHAIRYLASEIAISSVVKAVQVSNAYYSATSKLSNAKFLSHFKSKAALGVAAFTGALAALGFSLTNDGTLVSGSSIADDAKEVQGVYWICGSNTHYSSARSACEAYSSYPLRVVESDSNSVSYCRIYNTETGDCFLTGNPKAWRYDCSSSPNSTASTCSSDFQPSNGDPLSDDEASKGIIDYLKSLSDSEQLQFFGDSDGVVDSSLVADFESDNAPPMPDGQTPIPNMGDPAWDNAHLIATGVAQSSDSSSPNYVSSNDWDEAYHLANTVANGNSHITGLNSGAVTVPDSGTGTDAGSGTGTNVNVNVDFSGVESRIDTTNSLSQSILEQVTKVNSTTVPLQSLPNESVAASFWPVKYPDGLSGVLNNFIDDMKQTPIFEWLNEFVIDLGSGSLPAFDLCFNVIAGIDFGCYTLQADAYIWSAIKACMILFSVIVSRRIIFGG
ncbi:hypothetical protein, partial [Vibrio vulnificus]